MDRATESATSNGNQEVQRWRDRKLDPRNADLVTAGVDVGSVSSQAVVCADGAPCAWASMRTGPGSRDSANAVMALALEGTGLEVGHLHYVVGTGYGRVNVPFAHRRVSEIHCHARGGHFMYGDRVRTILDVGGQDYKAIRCDARGKVRDFLLNDKCAAGTGRGMELFADLLEIPVEEVGPLSLAVDEEPPPTSATCVVFAKSEALALVREGWSKAQVLAAFCGATSRRVADLVGQVGVEPGFAITGGVAKNRGVVTRVERALGVEAMKSDFDPQLAGALGAALLGVDLADRQRRKAARPR